jgi:hypothetical protein
MAKKKGNTVSLNNSTEKKINQNKNIYSFLSCAGNGASNAQSYGFNNCPANKKSNTPQSNISQSNTSHSNTSHSNTSQLNKRAKKKQNNGNNYEETQHLDSKLSSTENCADVVAENVLVSSIDLQDCEEKKYNENTPLKTSPPEESVPDSNTREENLDCNDQTSHNSYIPPLILSGGNGTVTRKKNLRGGISSPKENMEYYDPNITRKGDDLELNDSWKVWIHDNTNQDWGIESYESIYRIKNIGEMWRFLNSFDNLDKSTRQFFIMREGISPVWEDNNNKNGAICSIMLDNVNHHNNNITICIESFVSICVLILNESFVKNNSCINGLCYAIKQKNILIKLWVKNYKENKNFTDHLPVNLLNNLSNFIDEEIKFGNYNRQNKSRISIQFKQIIPDF